MSFKGMLCLSALACAVIFAAQTSARADNGASTNDGDPNQCIKWATGQQLVCTHPLPGSFPQCHTENYTYCQQYQDDLPQQ